VIQLAHVCRHGLGCHRRQVRLDRHAGQPAVCGVGVVLRDPARGGIKGNPAGDGLMDAESIMMMYARARVVHGRETVRNRQ
jgi:hypothetical protein